MKKNIILWLLFPLCSWGQTITNHKNAIVHSSLRVSGASISDASDATKALISIQYTDGLGRPLQTVGYRQSPTAKDIVFEGKTYDTFGRPFKTSLTAPTTVQTGEYQANPSSLASTFYGDNYAYSEITAFDNSPLNRLKIQYGPGQAWRTNTKNIQTFDEIAGATIRLYDADVSGNITLTGNFPANSLYKIRVIDEQGNTTVEIKDKLGNLIQREQPVGAETLVTYYVYDQWQRLRAVMQPEAYALNASIAKDSDAWTKWVFGYTYDAAGRLIEKHTPGGGWGYTVYDRNDFPVLTQDASQNGLNKWSFTKYDQFGRNIIMGELENTSDRAVLQTSFNGISTSYETWLGAAGYSSVSFPITYSSTAEKTWNFYDTYSWIDTEWAFNAGIAYNSGNYYSNAKGLQSGSAARSQDDPNKLYHSVFYYDYKGRTMQTFRTHDKGGTALATKPVITNLGYNFAGEVINEKVLYQVDGLANTETLATYEYDNTGRRLKVSHGINTAVAEVRRSEYDEAGRLKQAKIRATGTYTANGTSISGLQTIDYAYHLRGQLRGINLDGSGNPVPNASQGDLFSYKLDYETAGYYDGNIGKQYWQASTNNVAAGIRTYTFSYDAASRLKIATYNGIGSENYSLPAINYDRNGNIISLQRNGKLISTYGLMDNLTYSYTGNRLMRVEDTVTGDYEVDFVNRNSGSDDYSYYANGALKADKNEAINEIIYSTYVNQPIEIQLSNNRWIKNFYDGSGRLYKTTYSTGEYWEYLDGLVFKNGAFYQLATPEGRAVYQSGGWSYEYFHTDHLGNTRIAYKANGTALSKTSETSFDSWGIVLRDAGVVNTFQNRFEYQNKEKESTFHLRRIDFGARSYNASIGRFDRVDPLAGVSRRFSTYAYVYNNPLVFMDPDGLFADYYDNQGNYLGKDEVDDKKIYVLNSNVRPKLENKNINWGGQLGQSAANQLRQNSQEAEMPGKITHSLDPGEDPSSEKYNQFDKQIAVATHLFNREIAEGSPSIGKNYTLGKKASKLDVNLVKSLAYKESRLGQGQSISTKASDIFSMFNTGDYGDKGKMGMTLEDVKNGSGALSSTSWGLKWLYYKSFRSDDSKTKDFKGWEYAVQKYGPGAKEPNYKETVYTIYNSIKK